MFIKYTKDQTPAAHHVFLHHPRVHICWNAHFPLSPPSPVAPAAVHLCSRALDWSLTDRWWIGARARRCKKSRALRPPLLSSSSPLSSLSLRSRLSGAGHVTSPYSQQPSSRALAAPLRRFPWTRAFKGCRSEVLSWSRPNRGATNTDAVRVGSAGFGALQTKL